jgi:hypothetical protein
VLAIGTPLDEARRSPAPKEGVAALAAAFRFKPLKHNRIVTAAVKLGARALTRDLEKLIFTATTGRSGTKTLVKLFAAVPGCASLHEPWPNMSCAVLRAAANGDDALVREVYERVKSLNILRSAIGQRYYFEGNHCFVKTFAPLALEEFGDRVAIIHLVRPAVEVATSIFRLREEPGTALGNAWWLDYHAKTNLIPIADALDSDTELSHPFYKALWYWHEIEARVAALRASVPSVKIVRFETAWLDDKAKVLRLFAQLGLPVDEERIEPVIGSWCNQREDQKGISALPEERREHMLLRLREVLARRGLYSGSGPTG